MCVCLDVAAFGIPSPALFTLSWESSKEQAKEMRFLIDSQRAAFDTFLFSPGLTSQVNNWSCINYSHL